MSFYIGLGMQLMGFSSVGLCLLSGLTMGNYGQMEYLQLVGGATLFYLGTFFKNRAKTY